MTIETADTLVTTRFQGGAAGHTAVSADARVLIDSLVGLAGPASAITASFTYDLTMRGTMRECNHSTVAINATIPPHSSVAFDGGVTVGLTRTGAAAVGFVAGAGVTFLPTGVSGTCRAVGSEIFARQSLVTQDTWFISGDYT